jgi:hypothetical protein
VDTNDRRVRRAAERGFHALEGDATDLRWLEDIAHEHAVGAVIAWTGNSDVDKMVARWALDRLPAPRVLEGLPEDRLPPGVEPGRSSLETAIDLIDDGNAHVAFAVPEPGATPLLTLADKKPTAADAAPAQPPPAPDPAAPAKPDSGPPAPTLVLMNGPEPAAQAPLTA